jgi:hypothetical protein
MGAMTAAQMQTELARRVTQLAATDALAAVNRAIRWVNRQGSYTFQVAPPTTLAVPANGIATTPVTMDVGKAHVIYNTNGIPVSRVGVHDVWRSSNYNTPTGINYDAYTITGAAIVFFPAIAGGGTVNIIHHMITTDIAGAQTANTPKDFDDLILDLAEGEERRIYDVGAADLWLQMTARSQDQIKTLLDGYRSVTQNPMMGTEATQAVQEKMTQGRP